MSTEYLVYIDGNLMATPYENLSDALSTAENYINRANDVRVVTVTSTGDPNKQWKYDRSTSEFVESFVTWSDNP